MSTRHDELRLERTYPHPRERVFGAWADPAVKVRWFDLSHSADPEWGGDFRVGGVEYFHMGADASPRVSYEGRYSDIVDSERIVMTIEMTIDGRRSSVSLTSVEFADVDDGTRLLLIEQTVYLDGLEQPGERGGGVGSQLDELGRFLDRG